MNILLRLVNWVFVLVIFVSVSVEANNKSDKWEEIKETFIFNEHLQEPIGDDGLSEVQKESIRSYFMAMASKRSCWATKATYGLLSCTSIALTIGGLIFHSPLESVALIMTSYFVNQVSFLFTHLRFHADFISQPVSKMNHKTLFAFFHHYFDATVFSKFWGVYRALYFFETNDDGIPRLGGLGDSPSLHGLMGLAYLAMLPLPTAAALIGLQLLWTNMQAITHEWYHVHSDENKQKHFNFLLYYVLKGFERVGLIDQAKHKEHHNHDLKKLTSVKNFFDIKAYFMADGWDERLFEFYIYLSTSTGKSDSFLDKSKLKKIAENAEMLGVPLVIALNIAAVWLYQCVAV